MKIFYLIVSMVLIVANGVSQQEDRFRETVLPLVKKHCAKCHGAEKQKANLNLVATNPVDHEVWINVLEQLSAGEMPPDDEAKPSPAEIESLGEWVRSSLKNTDRPGFGNYLSHEKLFDVKPKEKPCSPARFWRIRPAVYRRLIENLAKGGYNDPFTLEGEHGFRDFASQYRLETPDLELLLSNANTAANRLTAFKIEGDKIRRDGWSAPNQFLAVLDPRKEPDDVELKEAIEWQFHRVLQREPTAEEMERFLAFTKNSMNRSGRVSGLKNMISAVMLLPEALYRSERGEGSPDEFGRVRLGQRELAYAIAYTLTDQRPDGTLLKNPLDTKEEIGNQIDRIFETEKIAKPRILAFFREYFGYGRAIDVFKDAELFSQHEASQLVKDTDFLVLYLFEKDREVLRELLTTGLSFVNFDFDSQKKIPRRNGKRRIHESYNLPPDWKWTPHQPVKLPGTQRAGILTQPSWLVAHSDNFDNHAILRGKWIRERLLGGTIPDLPITVDAQLPDDKTLTLRQRMEVTREEYCWRCHERMNPLGLTFELFDHFGRWRISELEKPVVTAGKIHRGIDPKIERDYEDPLSMVRAMAGSDRVRQVFVRHVFRFFLGRNETLRDAETLQEADRAYLASDGSMKALIKSLLLSDSFLYREPDRVVDRP